jgi:steroid 5-alpha reductase family enzyme
MSEQDISVNNQRASVVRHIVGLLIVGIVLGIGLLLSIAAKGFDDPWLDGISIMQTVAIISFGLNILAYIPAFLLQTERFYDITGCITYISCTIYSLVAGYSANGNNLRLQAIIASSLTMVWSLRLGIFLFTRIMRDGKDDRFDEIKKNFVRFLIAWTLQGLWVYLTAYAVFIVNSNGNTEDNIKPLEIVGLVIWALGFGIEVIADRQKTVWRKNPGNKGKFIEYGLWYYSRHPNYFGEVTLWIGMYLFCSSAFQVTWVSCISPIFVFLLIYFVSGVRLLEIKADQRWGGQPDYENFKKTTSVFVILPKLGKRNTQEIDSIN